MAGTAAGAAKAKATRAAKAAGRAPQDRRAPTVRAHRSTPAELGEAVEPAARAEVLAEIGPGADGLPDDGSVRVQFAGEVFDVRSPGDWRSSAQEALAQGLFQSWARGAMYPESAARFAEIDLTNRGCKQFMDAFDDAFKIRYGSDPKALARRFGS